MSIHSAHRGPLACLKPDSLTSKTTAPAVASSRTSSSSKAKTFKQLAKFYEILLKILSMHALNMLQIIFLISFWHPLDCMIET